MNGCIFFCGKANFLWRESGCQRVYRHPRVPPGGTSLQLSWVGAAGCSRLPPAGELSSEVERCHLTWEAGPSLTCTTQRSVDTGIQKPIFLASEEENPTGVYAPESFVCGSNESQTLPGPHTPFLSPALQSGPLLPDSCF